jgi:hypothetical protein
VPWSTALGPIFGPPEGRFFRPCSCKAQEPMRVQSSYAAGRFSLFEARKPLEVACFCGAVILSGEMIDFRIGATHTTISAGQCDFARCGNRIVRQRDPATYARAFCIVSPSCMQSKTVESDFTAAAAAVADSLATGFISGWKSAAAGGKINTRLDRLERSTALLKGYNRRNSICWHCCRLVAVCCSPFTTFPQRERASF